MTYEEMFGGDFPVRPDVADLGNGVFERIIDYVTIIPVLEKAEPISQKEIKKPELNKDDDNLNFNDEKLDPDKNHFENSEQIAALKTNLDPDSNKTSQDVTVPVKLAENDIVVEGGKTENGIVVYTAEDVKDVKKGIFGRLVTKRRK